MEKTTATSEKKKNVWGMVFMLFAVSTLLTLVPIFIAVSPVVGFLVHLFGLWITIYTVYILAKEYRTNKELFDIF